MSCCYIIYSSKFDKFYIGVTHFDFDLRLESHNLHKYGSKSFTFIADDWELFLKIDVFTFEHAVRIERKIKSMKSKTFIQNLKKYPELIEKIIKNTT